MRAASKASQLPSRFGTETTCRAEILLVKASRLNIFSPLRKAGLLSLGSELSCMWLVCSGCIGRICLDGKCFSLLVHILRHQLTSQRRTPGAKLVSRRQACPFIGSRLIVPADQQRSKHGHRSRKLMRRHCVHCNKSLCWSYLTI
jgi:hypothetical protein